MDGDYAAGEAATERQRVLRELAEWDDDETLPPRLTPDVMRRARSLPPHTCERGGSTMGLIRAGADQRGEWGGNRMRLIDANEGDRLERGVEPVEIVSVERHRGFVTYFRNGDRARVFTATATHGRRRFVAAASRGEREIRQLAYLLCRALQSGE